MSVTYCFEYPIEKLPDVELTIDLVSLQRLCDETILFFGNWKIRSERRVTTRVSLHTIKQQVNFLPQRNQILSLRVRVCVCEGGEGWWLEGVERIYTPKQPQTPPVSRTWLV